MKPAERPPFKLFFAHHFKHLPGRECAMYDETSGKYYIEKYYARNRILFYCLFALLFIAYAFAFIFATKNNSMFIGPGPELLLAYVTGSIALYFCLKLLFAFRYCCVKFTVIYGETKMKNKISFSDYWLIQYGSFSVRKYWSDANTAAVLFSDSNLFQVYSGPNIKGIRLIRVLLYSCFLFPFQTFSMPVIYESAFDFYIPFLTFYIILIFWDLLSFLICFAFWKLGHFEALPDLDIRAMAFRAPPADPPRVQKSI
jgi:hypothetical protein